MDLFSDEGKAFLSPNLLKEFFKLIGASKFSTFAYVTKSGGQVKASVFMFLKKIRI